MACDICGRNDKELTDLLEGYRTENIKQLCPSCEKIINDHLWKIRAVTMNINRSLLKRFMEAIKVRHGGGKQ